MAEADVIVPVIKEEPAVVEVAIDKPTAETAQSKSAVIPAEEGIKSLHEQIEKAKRDSAERLAAKDRIIADAFKKAQEAEREVVAVKLDQVGTVIDSLTQARNEAKRDYRLAMEAGDYDKAADAQERLATSAARLVEAEKGKIALADEAKAPQRQIAPQVDAVEAVARTMASPRSANWVRAHPEVVVNGEMSPVALEGHYGALRNGHAAESDGYFSYIESFVKDGGAPAARQERQVRQDPSQGRNMNAASVSAPVGRDAVQAPGAVRPDTIRLSPAEVQTAMDTYAPLYPKDSRDQLLKRYAMDRLALEEEGKIARRA